MSTAPLKERVDLVKYKTAEMQLSYASASLAFADRVDEFQDTMFFREIVWTSFFVNYSKPFKQSRDRNLGFGMRLPEDVVPPEHLDTHRNILTMRDKHFAHTDLDFRSSPFIAEPEELLMVLPTKAGMFFGISSLSPADSTIVNYKATLNAVIDSIATRSAQIIERWSRNLSVSSDSWWTINLSPEDDTILRPLDLNSKA
ncbi:hypothetical protein JIN85_19520 [Luteolibacter pohnpeiensis]|uniref:Uncharacterized protein n=1 Tax=Luteolibacter pohnpeiensis TaxID=454153 RepID=A0A934VXQ2_9BACT|nr:hypothetical protein [Luteolibacter pohnpeiensis]MBK1884615.1 hypothetical protein [Luteolibacter pohnpeiensis]